MSKVTQRTQNWILTSLKILLAVLVIVFFVVKLTDLPSIVSFIVLAAFLLFAMLLMIAYMTSTGRIKAKGAKKRRKYLLPYFYTKKRSDRASVQLSSKKNAVRTKNSQKKPGV